MSDIPKQYEPRDIQAKWFAFWEQHGYFNADPGTGKPAHTIMIPLPNVTGALHMGHALNSTCQDLINRWRRMQGYEALWMPGTDHAGIATQAVVERRMFEQEGLTRHTLGKTPAESRELLVDRIWKWKDTYEKRILSQLKSVGDSCDWRRTRFTLDPVCARAVRRTFFNMFRDGLIYRGKRLVNWDVHLQTAVADDEVFEEDTDGHFWTFSYPVVNADGKETGEFIRFSTTRPETTLGDTAVCVHPTDERYTHLMGKQVRIPVNGRLIPIIADPLLADKELGTGAVKVTPAHDPNDYACYLRNPHIGIINILNPDGTLNEHGGEWQGIDRLVAREQIVAKMAELGRFEAVEDRKIPLKHSDRSKTPVEPYLSDQWFVKMTDNEDGTPGLAQKAIDAVESGRVRFYPSRYAKTYIDWLGEKRDWCISRQLWWGHRIPVWSRELDLSRSGHRFLRDFPSYWNRVCFLDQSAAAPKDLCHEISQKHNFWIDPELTVFGFMEDLTNILDDTLHDEFSVSINAELVGLNYAFAAESTSEQTAKLMVCLDTDDEGIASFGANGFTQDPDVLDTWFSSALWPHATLGWPDREHNPPLDQAECTKQTLAASEHEASASVSLAHIAKNSVARVWKRVLSSEDRHDHTNYLVTVLLHIVDELPDPWTDAFTNEELRKRLSVDTKNSSFSVDAPNAGMILLGKLAESISLSCESDESFDVIRIRVLDHQDEIEPKLPETGFALERIARDPQRTSRSAGNSVLNEFYPHEPATTNHSVLITSRDIITLWVARMVLTGLYNMGDIPFRHVHVHPKILDGFGQTMSKSKGNGVDPVDLIDKYGTDAVRFTIASFAGETQDVKLPISYACPVCETLIPQTLKHQSAKPTPGKDGKLLKPTITCPKCKKNYQYTSPNYEPDDGQPVARMVSERFEYGRNFCNKFWNAARFAMLNLQDYQPGPVTADQLQLEDRWILSRLSTVANQMTEYLGRYQFDAATRAIRDFTWNEFCDWYLEMVKPRLREGARGEGLGSSEETLAEASASDPSTFNPQPSTSDESRATAQRVLLCVLDSLVRLLQPFTPFICEELWQRLKEIAPERAVGDMDSASGGCQPPVSPNVAESSAGLHRRLAMLETQPAAPGAHASGSSPNSYLLTPISSSPAAIIAPWPVIPRAWQDAALEKRFERLQETIVAVRNVRAIYNIPPGTPVKLLMRASAEVAGDMKSVAAQFDNLTKAVLEAAGAEVQRPTGAASFSLQDADGFIPLSGLIDTAAEKKRQEKEAETLRKHIAGHEAKLNNESFTSKAPENIIAQVRETLEGMKKQLASVEEILRDLG